MMESSACKSILETSAECSKDKSSWRKKIYYEKLLGNETIFMENLCFFSALKYCSYILCMMCKDLVCLGRLFQYRKLTPGWLTLYYQIEWIHFCLVCMIVSLWMSFWWDVVMLFSEAFKKFWSSQKAKNERKMEKLGKSKNSSWKLMSK
jgi:hypothetical protein